MSLPTPPHTTSKHLRAEKENISPAVLPSSLHLKQSARANRVIFSQANQQHPYTLHVRQLPCSTQQTRPIKSILKKPSIPTFLDLIPESKEREMTPELENPLQHPEYLASPIRTLVTSLEAQTTLNLHDLTEAYSVLSARIRAKLSEISEPSLPALQPLKLHSEALTKALQRDISRALVDPTEGFVKQAQTPVQTPRRQTLGTPKKRGLTEHEVKYARDLCALSHAALRFASNVFVHEILGPIFSDGDLETLLTHVLAIPLAHTLPTPNPRKTWALAIWVLQVQRLPQSLLAPAADRIAFALRRGIEGELGREGKKGAGADSYRAIHQLVVYQPQIFLSAFTPLVPSILEGLLSVVPVLRTQAAFALGGLALALSSSSSSSSSPAHALIAEHVTTYLAQQHVMRKTPSQPSPIFRAICVPFTSQAAAAVQPTTTDEGSEPLVLAQMQWSLTVIASFIVLTGPHFFTHPSTLKPSMKALELIMGHRRSTIRAVGAYVWRCLVLASMQALEEATSTASDEAASGELSLKWTLTETEAEASFRVSKQLLEGGLGLSMVAALVNPARRSSGGLVKAIEIVRELLMKKPLHSDGLSLFVQLLNPIPGAATKTWEDRRLIYPGLFDGRILNAEWKTLATVVRGARPEYCGIEDVRTLDPAEVEEHVETLTELWQEALSGVTISDDGCLPDSLTSIWVVLMRALSQPPTQILVTLLTRSPATWTIMPAQQTLSADFFQISFITQLFSAVQERFIGSNRRQLQTTASTMGGILLRDEWDLKDNNVRTSWVELVSMLSLISDQLLEDALMHSSWEVDVRLQLWRKIATKWLQTGDRPWASIGFLGGAPFFKDTMDLSDSDWQTWEAVVSTVNEAKDTSMSSMLDLIAENVSISGNSLSTLIRVTATLLNYVDLSADLSIPSVLLSLTNDVLVDAYPKSADPDHVLLAAATCCIETLTKIIENAPAEAVLVFVTSLEEGIEGWMMDIRGVLTKDRYNAVLGHFFKTALDRLRSLPPTAGTISILTSVFISCCASSVPDGTCPMALRDFWTDCCTLLPFDEIPLPLKPTLMALGIPCGEETQTQTSPPQKALAVPVAARCYIDSQDSIFGAPRGLLTGAQDSEGAIPLPTQIQGTDIHPQLDESDVDRADESPREGGITLDIKKELVNQALSFGSDVIDLTNVDGEPPSHVVPEAGRQPSTPPSSPFPTISPLHLNHGKFPSIPFSLGPNFTDSLVSPVRGNKTTAGAQTPNIPDSDDEAVFIESSLMRTPQTSLSSSTYTFRKRRKTSQGVGSPTKKHKEDEVSPIQSSQRQDASELNGVLGEYPSPTSHTLAALPRTVKTPARLLRSNSQQSCLSRRFVAVELPSLRSVKDRLVQDSTPTKSPAPRPSPRKPLARFFEDDLSPEQRQIKRRRRSKTTFFGPTSRNPHAPVSVRQIYDSPIKASPVFRRLRPVDTEIPGSDDSVQSSQRASDISDSGSRTGQISPAVITSPVPRTGLDIPSDDSFMIQTPSREARRRALRRSRTTPANLPGRPHILRRTQTEKNDSELVASLKQAHDAVRRHAVDLDLVDLVEATQILNEISRDLGEELGRKVASRGQVANL